MCASPLEFLRSGPPPPKVVLLPDGLFFTRAIPLAAGATEADVAAQVELALEAMSPFPIAQLYHGWFWLPGAEHAFAFAAYRRRFTAEQTASWSDAELVMPVSAALFGGTVDPATTVLLGSPEGLTAVHWETPALPSKLLFRPILPEATEEERARAREELVRDIGGSKTVIDLTMPPAAQPTHSEREIVFRSGDFVSRIPAPAAAALDVRDKAELAALRASRRRDVMLWRVVLGCAAALLLLLLGELALVGGNAWQKIRVAQRNGQAPTVQKIKEAQELAVSIDDLATKRLLPLEMVTLVVGVNSDRKPADITLTRIQTAPPPALYTLYIDAQTTNPAQIPVFQTELQKLPEVQEVRVENPQSQGDRSVFRLVVTFKPGSLKSESA